MYKLFGGDKPKHKLSKMKTSGGSKPPSDAKSNCNYGSLAKGVGKRTGQRK
jgi:hypothetical protein